MRDWLKACLPFDTLPGIGKVHPRWPQTKSNSSRLSRKGLAMGLSLAWALRLPC